MAASSSQRLSMEVMGTEATIVTLGPVDPAIALLRLRQLEQRWSRFLSDSDLSRLNQAGGATYQAHPDTIKLVSAMVTAWHRTDGAFDPTLLGPLLDLGYHTSRTDPNLRTEAVEYFGTGDPAAIRIDTATSLVKLPKGMALDPGGIGKGLAADLVVDELMAAGASGALVDVGGDLKVRGQAPDPRGWAIAVSANAGRGAGNSQEPGATLLLSEGGAATSTTKLRRWTASGVEYHHILDPATKSCSNSPVHTCTVVAGTGALAEAYTKVAFARTTTETLALFNRLDLAGRLALDDGSVLVTKAWPRFAWPAHPQQPAEERR